MLFHAVRLKPGEDLRGALDRLATERGWPAACVVTCVGSLREATLRMAGAAERRHFAGPFEIVSLTGTFSRDGSHCHIALSDSDGSLVGGHLLPGCPVHTTAEVVIAELPGLRFARHPDPATGYGELVISRAKS